MAAINVQVILDKMLSNFLEINDLEMAILSSPDNEEVEAIIDAIYELDKKSLEYFMYVERAQAIYEREGLDWNFDLTLLDEMSTLRENRRENARSRAVHAMG